MVFYYLFASDIIISIDSYFSFFFVIFSNRIVGNLKTLKKKYTVVTATITFEIQKKKYLKY